MNRIDVSSTVRKAHYFFIVDGGLLLEMFYLTRSTILAPYQWILAIPVLLAAVMNILFLRAFEKTLKHMRPAREPDAIPRCGTISEKIAVLHLWLHLGRLRLKVFVVAILVNLLSMVCLYRWLAM